MFDLQSHHIGIEKECTASKLKKGKWNHKHEAKKEREGARKLWGKGKQPVRTRGQPECIGTTLRSKSAVPHGNKTQLRAAKIRAERRNVGE